LILVGLIMANRTTGKVPIPYASSVTGAWVMQHNLFESEEFPRAKALVKLGYLLHEKDAAALATDPHFQAILAHPKAAVLRQPEVAGALARGDWMTVVRHEGLLDLLDESEIQEHLNAIEWRDEHPAHDKNAPSSAPRSGGEPPMGARFSGLR
jgi:membrane protein required for colicin V production